MNTRYLGYAALSALLWLTQAAKAADEAQSAERIEHGHYLAKVSGCNDCHTPGYLQGEGNVPEDQWLTGSSVGFQGPWGTTYPANLRLYVRGLSEAQWLKRVREPMRPPMPWFNLSAMTDRDLEDLYRFIRALGPAGEPGREAVAPGVAVNTPFFDFVPKNPPALAHR